MKIYLKALGLALLAFGILNFAKANAEENSAKSVPNVLVTIKPLHSWVSAVMQGVATPELLIQGAESVHNYSLKPSGADAISNADIIFRVDKEMEAYLQKPFEALAPKAKIIDLARASGVTLLAGRKGGMFEAHHHGHEGGGHHHESGIDWHFWLDPQNAMAATKEIAKILSEADPSHKDIYQENARQYIESLKQLTTKIEQKLKSHENINFIVFHDAYHYFETRFHLHALGSITIDPERQAGAKRIKQIRDKIIQTHAVCVFAEPQFKPAIVDTLIEGTQAQAGTLDPLGAALDPGKDAYERLLLNLTDGLAQCDINAKAAAQLK